MMEKSDRKGTSEPKIEPKCDAVTVKVPSDEYEVQSKQQRRKKQLWVAVAIILVLGIIVSAGSMLIFLLGPKSSNGDSKDIDNALVPEKAVISTFNKGHSQPPSIPAEFNIIVKFDLNRQAKLKTTLHFWKTDFSGDFQV